MKSRKVQGGTRGAFVEELANEAELGASRGELSTCIRSQSNSVVRIATQTFL